MIHKYRILKIMRIDYSYEYIFKEDSYSKEKKSNTNILQINSLSSLKLSTLQITAVPLFITERRAMYFVLLYSHCLKEKPSLFIIQLNLASSYGVYPTGKHGDVWDYLS